MAIEAFVFRPLARQRAGRSEWFDDVGARIFETALGAGPAGTVGCFEGGRCTKLSSQSMLAVEDDAAPARFCAGPGVGEAAEVHVINDAGGPVVGELDE